jgi:membrane protease YdiL (CAAX protease family)
MLGLLFPVLLAVAATVVGYASNRVEWAAREFGQYAPPTFLPENLRFDPWWLLLFLAAFGEEFVFRGLLQSRFIERYGAYRGLVLLGVIWGAFHFPGDRYSGLSSAAVLEHLLFRVAGCVAMGFVLSWLTLRSGSILPATLAHGVSNILIYAGLFAAASFGDIVRIGLWAALAYILFRYWPPQTDDAGAPVADPAVEPAISAGDAI